MPASEAEGRGRNDAGHSGDEEDEAGTEIGVHLRPLGDYANGLWLIASGRFSLSELRGIDARKGSMSLAEIQVISTSMWNIRN